MPSKVKVRFAPSPTGNLHIGGVRTALFNYLFARKNKGEFVLRIEDTDFERSNDEFLIDICESLQWLGLNWDHGPEQEFIKKNKYFQSERLSIYKEHTQELLYSGKAYRCFCTRERLNNLREQQKDNKQDFIGYDGHCRNLSLNEIEKKLKSGDEYTVRIKLPDIEEVVFNDLVRGEISVKTEILDDFILVRSDGIPTYNFSVVVDDHEMEISHVIRGEDHISNTPKQILIYKQFHWPVPEFGHLPLILGDDGKLLSKRHGAVSVLEYRKEGYVKEAITNYLALLGWSYDGERELFSFDELEKLFEINKVSKTAARFSGDKLLWFNSRYISEKLPDERTEEVLPYLLENEIISQVTSANKEKVKKIVEILGDRLKKYSDILTFVEPFFKAPDTLDEKGERKFLQKPDILNVIQEINNDFHKLDSKSFFRDEIEKLIRGVSDKHDIKVNKVIQGLRVLLTGKLFSAGLFETIEVMGKDMVTERIDSYLNKE